MQLSAAAQAGGCGRQQRKPNTQACAARGAMVPRRAPRKGASPCAAQFAGEPELCNLFIFIPGRMLFALAPSLRAGAGMQGAQGQNVSRIGHVQRFRAQPRLQRRVRALVNVFSSSPLFTLYFYFDICFMYFVQHRTFKKGGLVAGLFLTLVVAVLAVSTRPAFKSVPF